jgi:hypothetical protein
MKEVEEVEEVKEVKEREGRARSCDRLIERKWGTLRRGGCP